MGGDNKDNVLNWKDIYTKPQPYSKLTDQEIAELTQILLKLKQLQLGPFQRKWVNSVYANIDKGWNVSSRQAFVIRKITLRCGLEWPENIPVTEPEPKDRSD